MLLSLSLKCIAGRSARFDDESISALLCLFATDSDRPTYRPPHLRPAPTSSQGNSIPVSKHLETSRLRNQCWNRCSAGHCAFVGAQRARDLGDHEFARQARWAGVPTRCCGHGTKELTYIFAMPDAAACSHSGYPVRSALPIARPSADAMPRHDPHAAPSMRPRSM